MKNINKKNNNSAFKSTVPRTATLMASIVVGFMGLSGCQPGGGGTEKQLTIHQEQIAQLETRVKLLEKTQEETKDVLTNFRTHLLVIETALKTAADKKRK